MRRVTGYQDIEKPTLLYIVQRYGNPLIFLISEVELRPRGPDIARASLAESALHPLQRNRRR
jgi:hypothetical protein